MTFPDTAPVATLKVPHTDATTITEKNDSPRRRFLAVYKQMLLAAFFALLVMIGFLAVLIVPFFIYYVSGDKNQLHDPPILTVVQFAGTVGALFSTLIRLYNLEDLPKAIVARELEGLSSTYLLIFSLVPAVLGFVSATAIHMLFASGLLQGGLFPKFVCKLADGKCMDFGTLITGFGPEEAKDYAKIIVWGFIAGFAERLVPDTLRNLSKSAQQRDSGDPLGGPPPKRTS